MKLKIISLSCSIFLALPFSYAFGGMASFNHWKISKINVCFAEKETEYFLNDMKGFKKDWKLREKIVIQKLLEEEFTLERTGYSFFGFQDCKNTKNINVVVGLRKRFSKSSLAGISAMATVGPLNTPLTNYIEATGAVVFSPTFLDKTTIIHEFGHILGLEHEHDHPQAKYKALKPCPFYKDNSEDLTNHIYTEFDERSVMNYCNSEGHNLKKSGLSAKDQELLLDIYNLK